jgi:hypothetical protein
MSRQKRQPDIGAERETDEMRAPRRYIFANDLRDEIRGLLERAPPDVMAVPMARQIGDETIEIRQLLDLLLPHPAAGSDCVQEYDGG